MTFKRITIAGAALNARGVLFWFTVPTLSATDQPLLYDVDPFQLTPDNFLFL